MRETLPFLMIVVGLILAIIFLVVRLSMPTAGKLCIVSDFVDIMMFISWAVVSFGAAVAFTLAKSILGAIGCVLLGIALVVGAFSSAKVILDIGSKPQTIVIENCEYEYQHRNRNRDSYTLKGTCDGQVYSFDVDGIDTEILEKLGAEKGSAKVTYYKHSESVRDVEVL